jgi:hypothetical protein
MKYSVFILLFLLMIFTSCDKEKDLYSGSDDRNFSNARINSDNSNEKMEDDINAFIKKLEDPENEANMDYIEAFEYVEATLNYNYVNFDYSKCENIETFDSYIDISPDEEGMMSMVAISVAYDSILAEWRTRYYSIDEENKTPIVFDITEVTQARVFFTMVVGYGSLNLSYWENPTTPPTGVYFTQAAQNYSNGMMAQINNELISRTPSGMRAYYVLFGGQYIKNYEALNYPSGSADISLPGNDGITDYLFFFSSSLSPYQNFHLYLSVPPQLDEYGFYATQLGQYVTNYAANHGGNRVSLCDVYSFSSSQGSTITIAAHGVNFYYGKEYYTSTSLSTL